MSSEPAGAERAEAALRPSRGGMGLSKPGLPGDGAELRGWD